MSHTTPEIIKSFLPLFYVSKCFGCNLFSLPSPLTATNINTSLTAIDILLCLIQFAFYVFIVHPLSLKWNNYDAVFNNDFAAKSGSSGLVVIVFIGNILTYVLSFTNLFITIMDMRNSANTRRILLLFIEFDEQVIKKLLD